MNYVKNNHSEYFDEILKRLETVEGFGESKPLSVDRLNGKRILIGDNNMPLGRKLNRRIEVVFSLSGSRGKTFRQ